VTDQPPTSSTRSYGCSFGCGNPYDYIVTSVADATTEFLCVPCYIRLATEMIQAITEPDNPDVVAKLAAVGVLDTAPMHEHNVHSRGHNAPLTTDDDDLIETYSAVITEDELPPEFR